MDKPKTGYQARVAAAIAGTLLALAWLAGGLLPARLSIAVYVVFGGFKPATSTLLAFVALQLAFSVGIFFRQRVAWILGVAFTAAQLAAMFVLTISILIGGDLLVGLMAIGIFGSVFALQLTAFEEMEPTGQSHVIASAVGVLTAVLWMVDGLSQGRWTAATLTAFGGRDVPLTYVGIACALQLGLSIGVYFKNRAAWAFAMSLAATMGLPMVIAIARLLWHKQFVDGVTALFLHASLLTVQAIALTDRAELKPSNA